MSKGKIVRWVLAVLAAVFVLIQFVPVDRTNPPVESEIPAPEAVRAVLRRACYDCHSNETTWPWYSRIAPASWLVAWDVHEGRRALNFSTWNRLDEKERREAIHEIREEIVEGEMPPLAYLLLHRDAGLTGRDKAALEAWSPLGEDGESYRESLHRDGLGDR